MAMIRYLDTRGVLPTPRTFSEALLEGIAPGGGLFVPERLPSFSVDAVVALAAMPYHARAAAVYEA
ncbi:MAG: threonine synthase, partial [Thermoleophilia bacterium]|nr:threonine synthase [Thermoleophilia bacterium]